MLVRMPLTTVKLDTTTRDRLLAEARREGRTVGQLLDAMLAERERASRFAALRAAISATPEELRRSWEDETRSFDVTSADGSSRT